MQIEVAVLSERGGRAVNEDACGFWSGNGTCFCVLSDGAGGHGGGDVASKLVVQQVLEFLREREDCSAETIGLALRHANDVLLQHQQARVEVSDMRATAVVLAIDFHRRHASWGHIGDSRLYYFRDGQIRAQTRDDSVVQNLVEAGYLEPHATRQSRARNQLLKAMGEKNDFDPAVDRAALPLNEQDKFLLCTDGVWQYLEDSELHRVASVSSSPSESLRIIDSQVLERGSPNQDNYSAIAVWCKDGD